ncbi:effector binding domain-containing protein [Paenibacillus dendritiformis]|uniref:effector binding domain-containing protein n=1 Tax=Paenibacillus dendritiformis TaxID=130049 RepID=UPI00143D2A7C|nr:effector binding domain-containing protein [Paenibacillus dendritiformis]NKI20373.1 transcriptional regulator [Paenibacillus dendritiformis]NRF98255.1 effector binding domain-containing protein [Paenibacillus dendritiformis]
MEQTLQRECQSCGMPLHSEEQLGTDKGNGKVQDYCIYCYEDGAFKQPDMTMEEMIETCVPFVVENGMEEQAARAMLKNYLPTLKRWADQAGMTVPDLQPVKIIERGEMTLAGISARTSNMREYTPEAVIPQMWERFWTEGLLARIPNAAEPGVIYGCYHDYENGASGEYSMLIGTSVITDAALPEGFKAVTVPAAKYAVFTTARGPLAQVVTEAWAAIWKWSSASEMTRTFTGDFERYDERSANPEDAQVDIYIAVQ